MADFPSDKYIFDCKYVAFCIELNTIIRLEIAISFLFLIFPCCYFYVMSQSTFPEYIRPRPLIACLNCAAKGEVTKIFRLMSISLYPTKYLYVPKVEKNVLTYTIKTCCIHFEQNRLVFILTDTCIIREKLE